MCLREGKDRTEMQERRKEEEKSLNKVGTMFTETYLQPKSKKMWSAFCNFGEFALSMKNILTLFIVMFNALKVETLKDTCSKLGFFYPHAFPS